MFDYLLFWLPVVLPVAAGFAIIFAHTKQDKPHLQRFGLGFALIIFGMLILIQQYRTAEAFARERAETIRKISESVSVKVSEEIDTTIGSQYRQIMTSITRINTQLQRLQGAPSLPKGAVAAGAGSTRDKSASTDSSPNGSGKVRLSWQHENSTHTDAPYAAVIRIDTDAPINPVRLAILCDVPLKAAELENGSPTTDGGSSIYKADPHIFLINITTEGPAPLSPDTPLVFHFYSDQPINIVKFERSLR